jgi:hypothetical protein
MLKTEKLNVEVKLTTRQSNEKIVLRNQYTPADGMGWARLFVDCYYC